MSDMRWLTDYNSWPAKSRTWAPAAALIVLVLFWLIFGWGFLLSLVLALVALVAVVWFTREDTHTGAGRPPVSRSAPPPAATPRPSPDPAPTPAATAPVPPVAPPATPPAADPAASSPVAPPEPPASKPPVAETAPADAASERVRAAARAAGDAARAMDAPPDASRPPGLDAPRGGAADDLKRINGVGPKIEAQLNALGIYHFGQIAGWTEREVAWIDSHLEGFHGRATRDGWVGQAQVLAAGGTIDSSQRGDRGEAGDD